MTEEEFEKMETEMWDENVREFTAMIEYLRKIIKPESFDKENNQ